MKATLTALRSQSRRPDLVTVLNCDDAAPIGPSLGHGFEGIEVVDLTRNLGSAGGFAEALRIGCERGLSWMWLLDDDAVPRPDALAELTRVAGGTDDSVGILAALQVTHRATYGVSYWRDRVVAVPDTLRQGSTPFDVDLAYWAGMYVARSVVEQIGYPRREFFRCFGDYEYCLRARLAGLRILAVPTSQVAHDHGPPTVVVRFGRASIRLRYPPSRFYYHSRNMAYTVRFVLRSRRAVFFHLVTQIRQIIGDLVYADRKVRRAWMRALGTIHGLTGRLGRRADLE